MMANKPWVFMLISLFILSSLSTAAVPAKPEDSHPNKQNALGGEAGGEWYNLYTKTVFFFVQREIQDEFVTPPECKELRVEAVMSDYFTGESVIFIKSEGHQGSHTQWDTGIYFLGYFIWPRVRYFYEYMFDPGLQEVKIWAAGAFGSVTYWVNGTSG